MILKTIKHCPKTMHKNNQRILSTEPKNHKNKYSMPII